MNENVEVINGDDKKSSLQRETAIGQREKLLLSRYDFQTDIKTIRKKNNVPIEGFREMSDFDNWFLGGFAENLQKDIRSLYLNKNYDLSKVASWGLYCYVCFNDLKGASLYGVYPHVRPVKSFQRKSQGAYALFFYDHTTEAEIRSVFNNFKKNHLEDKRQHTIADLKLKKMIRANQLRQSGLKWKEVASVLSDEFNDKYIQYNDARKLVEQYKKLTNTK